MAGDMGPPQYLRTQEQQNQQGMQNQTQSLFGNTSQTQTPLASLMPHLENLWGTASGALGGMTPYSGPMVAAATPNSWAGAAMLQDAVNRAQSLQGFDQPGLDLLQSTIQGQYLSPESNPFIKGAVNAAIRRVQEPLMTSVLPSISDQAIASGAYGGARQDLSQERAVKEFGQTAADTASNIYFQNYAAERDRQLASVPALQQALQQTVNFASLPGQIQLQRGEIERGLVQLSLDNALAMAREQQEAPFRGLQAATGALGTGLGFGTTTGTTQQTQLANLMKTLQGAELTTKQNPDYQSPFLQLLKSGVGLGSGIAGIGGPQGFGLWGR